MVNAIRLEGCWCAGVVRNVDFPLVLVKLCCFFLLAWPGDTHHFSVRDARQKAGAWMKHKLSAEVAAPKMIGDALNSVRL